MVALTSLGRDWKSADKNILQSGFIVDFCYKSKMAPMRTFYRKRLLTETRIYTRKANLESEWDALVSSENNLEPEK